MAGTNCHISIAWKFSPWREPPLFPVICGSSAPPLLDRLKWTAMRSIASQRPHWRAPAWSWWNLWWNLAILFWGGSDTMDWLFRSRIAQLGHRRGHPWKTFWVIVPYLGRTTGCHHGSLCIFVFRWISGICRPQCLRLCLRWWLRFTSS